MKNLFILFIFFGCSLLNKEANNQQMTQPPSWVYSPYDLCVENEEICATGEGKTFADADSQARSNLASIFEIKISSEFQSFNQSINHTAWDSIVQQDVHKSLSESVDQILETVEIKKRFKSAGLTYAMASMNRKISGDLIGGRIKNIDSELEVLWKRKQRTNLRKIMTLALEREKLHERYSLIMQSSIPSSVSYKNVLEWRDLKPQEEPLLLRVGHAPEWMIDKIKDLLTESGFRIVKNDAKKVVELDVTSIKEFLNVSGFEKYTFSLNLSSSIDGVKLKEMTVSETVTGRNQSDALIKVKSFFNNYLEKNISYLNLD